MQCAHPRKQAERTTKDSANKCSKMHKQLDITSFGKMSTQDSPNYLTGYTTTEPNQLKMCCVHCFNTAEHPKIVSHAVAVHTFKNIAWEVWENYPMLYDSLHCAGTFCTVATSMGQSWGRGPSQCYCKCRTSFDIPPWQYQKNMWNACCKIELFSICSARPAGLAKQLAWNGRGLELKTLVIFNWIYPWQVRKWSRWHSWGIQIDILLRVNIAGTHDHADKNTTFHNRTNSKGNIHHHISDTKQEPISKSQLQ